MSDEVFPGGLSILSLNPRITEEFMDDELKQTLVLNGFSFTRDWAKLTTPEALQILGSILGVPAEYGEFDVTFVITIDTLMKMLAIQLRVRYGIPVIIMGMNTPRVVMCPLNVDYRRNGLRQNRPD